MAQTVIEDFDAESVVGWSFVSDRVMGGVSDGVAGLMTEDGISFARLQGTVSTKNNGGFIQLRRGLSGLPADSTGINLRLRGNGMRYFVHLRTAESTRPTFYYAAPFVAGSDWAEVPLEWSDFTPNRGYTDEPLTPARISSIGLVAYGADFEAQLDIDQITLNAD